MTRMGADEDASRTAGETTVVSVFARRPGVWITVAVLLAAALLGIVQARGPLVQVAVVTRSDIQQHLIASGRVRVITRVQLTAQVAGRVTQVAVREGHRVRPGELLAHIDDQEA